jgi:acetyl-CoA acetyltransferase
MERADGSTGSTALFLARQAIASGAADCPLALGFEQMSPAALVTVKDRPSPFDRFDEATDDMVGHGAGTHVIARLADSLVEVRSKLTAHIPDMRSSTAAIRLQ